MPGLLSGWCREVARAVVPLRCAGCDAWDAVACSACAGVLHPTWVEAHAGALDAPLPVCALGWYSGPLRRMVLAWKMAGRRDLEPVLRAGLAEATTHLMGRLGGGLPAGRELWVVPAASGPGRAIRGRASLMRIAPSVAQTIAGLGHPSRVVAALGTTGVRLRGQRSAGSRGRRRVRMRARVNFAGGFVVLFDDVSATGATLQAAREAVEAADGVVVGAVVLAGTPAPGRHTRPRLSLGPDLD